MVGQTKRFGPLILSGWMISQSGGMSDAYVLRATGCPSVGAVAIVGNKRKCALNVEDATAEVSSRCVVTDALWDSSFRFTGSTALIRCEFHCGKATRGTLDEIGFRPAIPRDFEANSPSENDEPS